MMVTNDWIWAGTTTVTNAFQTVAPPQPAKPVKLKKHKTLEETLKEQEVYLTKLYGQKRPSDRYTDPEIYI